MSSIAGRMKCIFRTIPSLVKAIIADKGIYTYTLGGLWYGANMLCNGFARNKVQERYISRDAEFICVDVNGRKINVIEGVYKPGELVWLYNETYGSYPDNPHAYIKHQITIAEGDVVIDAGACEGFFIHVALNYGCGHIYAFEPVKSLNRGLCKTFMGNSRVSIIPCALGSDNGRSRISSNAEYVCEAKLDDDRGDEVDKVTIDAFANEQKIERIDFIKMDIEGAEIAAIEGARGVLSRYAPKLAIAVYHEYETAERLRNIILSINSDYKVDYGGCYMFEKPFRPYMLYAYCVNRAKLS